MKAFFIEKKSQNRIPFWGDNIVYSLFLLISFCIFSLFSHIFLFLFSDNKVDFFVHELSQVATYFLPVDKTLSQKILILDEVIKDYQAGENVLQTKKQEIFDLWKYITDNKIYLTKLGFTNYESIMNLLSEAYEYREEIFNLLGENQTFNYLILLENANEKRPNGWFFGSFVFVKLSWGHIKELQVIDSYLPDYVAPKTRIPLPEWYQKLYDVDEVGFIAGNKFWFTDRDGKNIKTLYELIFNKEYDPDRVKLFFEPEKWTMLHNQYIKGVIFLNSSLLSDFLPWFQEKAREWQFTNASVDLIRGENRSNKKEMYLKDVVEYFNNNTKGILKNLILHREKILDKKYLQFYFSNISEDFHQFLQKKQLNTFFSEDKMFFRNTNLSTNKSDGFVKKNVQLFDLTSQKILFSTENSVLDLTQLSSWNYMIQIDYDFNIPERYFNFIKKLETKYGITLWEREKFILLMSPLQDQDSYWRKTRELIYYPPQMTFLSAEGNFKNLRKSSTDHWAQILVYDTQIEKNNTTKQVRLFFSLF